MRAVGHGRRHIAAVIAEVRAVAQRDGYAALVQAAAVQVDIVVEGERLLAPAIAGQNPPVVRQMLDIHPAPAVAERTGQAVGVHVDVVGVVAQTETVLRQHRVLRQGDDDAAIVVGGNRAVAGLLKPGNLIRSGGTIVWQLADKVHGIARAVPGVKVRGDRGEYHIAVQHAVHRTVGDGLLLAVSHKGHGDGGVAVAP